MNLKIQTTPQDRQAKLDTLVKRMCQDLEATGGCQETYNSDCSWCTNAGMCVRIDNIAEYYSRSDEPIPYYEPGW